MGLKHFVMILALFFLASCAPNAGTEIVNTPNPNESAGGKKKTDTALYEVSVTLPEGWTFTEYGPDVTPGAESFTDTDPATVTVAQFDYGQSRFTVFFSELSSDQTLTDFIRERRPEGEFDLEEFTEVNAEVALFVQEEPGPRDGFVLDLYIAVEGYVLWMRAEAVAETNEEKVKIMNVFLEQILPTIEFVPKK